LARARALRDRAAKSKMVGQSMLGPQACLAIAKALTEGHLREAKRQE
jgi:hypothetical protein